MAVTFTVSFVIFHVIVVNLWNIYMINFNVYLGSHKKVISFYVLCWALTLQTLSVYSSYVTKIWKQKLTIFNVQWPKEKIN